ncbi:MAG: outer membrane beta-barrel protein [Terracidiphilus sp.]
MRKSAFFLLLCVLSAGTAAVQAQVAPSATRSQLSLTAGGLGSLFQPDYAGNVVAETAPNHLYGVGAYVDLKFTRWVQLEGEGRWLRFNTYESINEDNYLIGPRVPIHTFHFMHATPYGKVLFGYGKMNFEYSYAYGRFADIAYGGGVDLKLTNRISLRAIDFEYQQWPNWVNGTLKPYGGSVGVSYRVF